MVPKWEKADEADAAIQWQCDLIASDSTWATSEAVKKTKETDDVIGDGLETTRINQREPADGCRDNTL